MGLKQFPCCGSAHPAISMMLALRAEEGVAAADAARIEIMPHRRRLPHTDNPDPRTPLAAKFSVQYAVARALADGAVRLAHFEGEAHLDPKIREIMARTVAYPHPDMADDSVEQFGAEVRVTLRDGRIVARRVDGLIGRGGDNPMSSDELWEKFYDCGRRALPKQDILPLFERLESLEKVADMRDVTRLLARRTAPGATPVGPSAPSPAPTQMNTLQETAWVP
jgi:2-methylcitrate dehydratase PrpD